jgi:hypothetical protein
VVSEILDSGELAKRWHVPESWIRSKVRPRTPTARQIPHVRFGRYIRFEWGSPELEEWLSRHREGGQRMSGNFKGENNAKTHS